MEHDDQLVTAVLQGQASAFNAIIMRYKGMVYGLALSYLKDFDAAYDLSQEVFLRAFLNLDRLQDRSKLSAWLRALTINACKMALRQNRDTIPLEDLDLTSNVPADGVRSETPDEIWEQEERKGVVLRALSRLSEENRQALTLYYLDERSAAEIAAFLGLSQTAIRQRLHRARAYLKTEVMHMIEETLQQTAPGDEFQEELKRLLGQAKAFFHRTEPGKAVPVLEQAAYLAPDNTLVAVLLADAYTWGKSAEEVTADPTPNDKARMVLEAVLERDPHNMMARIRLTDLQTVTTNFAETLEARTRDLQLARGGPWEPLALLHLARVYTPRCRHEEALRHYHDLIALEPRLAGTAYLDIGVSYYMYGSLEEAIDSLKKAVQFFEDQSSKTMEDYLQSLAGKGYTEFWKTDQQQLDLFHAQSWLAGLYAKKGERQLATTHLHAAIKILNRKKLHSQRPRLVKEIFRLVHDLFPELAEEPLLQQL